MDNKLMPRTFDSLAMPMTSWPNNINLRAASEETITREGGILC
jgi:hypothetical protein